MRESKLKCDGCGKAIDESKPYYVATYNAQRQFGETLVAGEVVMMEVHNKACYFKAINDLSEETVLNEPDKLIAETVPDDIREAIKRALESGDPLPPHFDDALRHHKDLRD